MSYYNSGHYTTSFGPPLSPWIKKLMIAMGIIFAFQSFFSMQWFVSYPRLDWITRFFGLTPYMVWHRFAVWQLVTYMFLHGGIAHIFFNLFALWMFGSELEYKWGSQFFLKYFFITGIGAGVCVTLFTPNAHIPTVGVSGVIYGILLAFALTFPNRYIYLYFFVPIKAKYFALFFGLLEFFSTVSHSSDGIAHVAHLGGMVIGYIYLDYPNIRRRILRLINKYKFRSQDKYKWN